MPTGSEIPTEFPNGLHVKYISKLLNPDNLTKLWFPDNPFENSRGIPNSVRGQEGTYGERGKTVRDPGRGGTQNR